MAAGKKGKIKVQVKILKGGGKKEKKLQKR